MTSSGERQRSIHFWIDLGLRELARSGPDGMTIEALCRKAGKTKGSFYAHFDRHDEFLLALVTRWRQRDTEALIDEANVESTLQGRISKLNLLAARVDGNLERGVRALAERHPTIVEHVGQVDDLRIAYLADLLRHARNCSAAEALDLATIEYAAYLGFQAMRPRLDPCRLEHLQGVLAKLFYADLPEM